MYDEPSFFAKRLFSVCLVCIFFKGISENGPISWACLECTCSWHNNSARELVNISSFGKQIIGFDVACASELFQMRL